MLTTVPQIRIDAEDRPVNEQRRVANTDTEIQHEDVRTAQLILRNGQGDSSALVALYEQYGRLAFSLAYRVTGNAATAEEVVQDAFMRVWKNAPSFDADRGKVRTWLMSIVHNRSIDMIRRKQHTSETPADTDMIDRTTSMPDVWSEVSAALTRDDVRAAVNQLPPEQRIVIEQAYFDGLTQHEISERTGIPLGTVKSRMRLGLKKLHELMKNDEDEH